MSIQIIRNETSKDWSLGGHRALMDVTNQNTKLERTYTKGYLPDKLQASYTLQYEKGKETFVKFKFPPRQQENNFIIEMFDSNDSPLNGQTIRLDNSDNINFTVIIDRATLQTISNSPMLLYRNIEVTYTTESSETELFETENTETTTTTIPFYLFRPSEESLHFQTLDITEKRLYIRMYADLKGVRSVVPPDNLSGPDQTNLYRVEYSPLGEYDIQRSQPINRGFIDGDNPNAYVVDFKRIDFTNDMDDRYDIIFNKDGFIKNSNEDSLFDTSYEVQITSADNLVERIDYMTRLTYNSAEVSDLDFTSPNGLIDVPDLGVKLYQYLPSLGRAGATPSDADYTQFYMLADLQGFSPIAVNALTMNGQTPSSAEGLFGTKRWGPFNKGEKIQIFGEMDSGQSRASLVLKSYCILREPAADGTPQASTLDMPTMTVNLLRVDDVVNPGTSTETVYAPPPTKLFTLNTTVPDAVTLVDVLEMTDGGSLFSLEEDQWSWERLFEVSPDDPTRIFIYRIRLVQPTDQPMLDGILQFRKSYRDGLFGPWEDVPTNMGDYARGVPSSDLTPIILDGSFIANGATTIDIGLIPFDDRGQSVYEFRTISAEYPDVYRSPIPDDRFLMFANTPPDPIIDGPADPSNDPTVEI